MKRLPIGKKKIAVVITLLILALTQLAVLTKGNSPSNKKTPLPEIKEEREDKLSPTVQDLFDEEQNIQSPVLGSDVQVHPERVTARVVKVRDGDTIDVDFGNSNIKTVRYIGIDTPETVDPRKPLQCFGNEASNINKSLVQNQTVQLEKDVSETDKYGRLLRYVYLGDILVNKYLVEEGFAHSSPYPPDIKYQEDLDSAEEEARVTSKGLWGACADSAFSGQNSPRTGSNSEDKDCLDFSTHQEAQNYFESKGGSSTNNVDKLDGSDRDGQVCETLP